MATQINWGEFHPEGTQFKTDGDIVKHLQGLDREAAQKLPYNREHANFDNYIFTDFANSKETLLIQPIAHLRIHHVLNYCVEHFASEGKVSVGVRDLNRIMMNMTECPRNVIHNYLNEQVMKEITDMLYDIEHQFRTDTSTRRSEEIHLFMLAPKADVDAYLQAKYPFLSYSLDYVPAMYAVAPEKVVLFREDGTHYPAHGKSFPDPKDITQLSDEVLTHYRLRKLEYLASITE